MRRLMLLVAMLLVGVVGCGLPADSRPEVLDPSVLPSNLVATHGTAPAPATPDTATTVYFISHDHLVGASRETNLHNVPDDAVRALLLGPTADETDAGLSSAIPAETRLISLDLAGSVASVDLSAEFGAVGGSQQVLAVAQIVFTLTASPSISSVRFAIDGRPIEVPGGSGSLSTAPRQRRDYRPQAPLHQVTGQTAATTANSSPAVESLRRTASAPRL